MKVATWNVNGIRARGAQVEAWIAEAQPEVLCLQELKATPEQVPATLRELPGYWCYWHGGKAYSGVGLLVAKAHCPEPPPFTHPEFDMEHRIVTAQVGEVLIASIYVPNGGKDFSEKLRFLRALEAYTAAATAAGTSLLLCGDYNIAHTPADVHPKERRDVIGQLPVEREQFTRLLQTGLVDLGRQLHPADEQMFTWWAPWRQMKQRNIGWRLDYLLASPVLAARAQSCVVERETGTSDHGPVVATFR